MVDQLKMSIFCLNKTKMELSPHCAVALSTSEEIAMSGLKRAFTVALATCALCGSVAAGDAKNYRQIESDIRSATYGSPSRKKAAPNRVAKTTANYQTGNIDRTQPGNAAKYQTGNIDRTTTGNPAKYRTTSIVRTKAGHPVKYQTGNIIRTTTGNPAGLEIGNANSTKGGNPATYQTGNIDRTHTK